MDGSEFDWFALFKRMDESENGTATVPATHDAHTQNQNGQSMDVDSSEIGNDTTADNLTSATCPTSENTLEALDITTHPQTPPLQGPELEMHGSNSDLEQEYCNSFGIDEDFWKDIGEPDPFHREESPPPCPDLDRPKIPVRLDTSIHSVGTPSLTSSPWSSGSTVPSLFGNLRTVAIDPASVDKVSTDQASTDQASTDQVAITNTSAVQVTIDQTATAQIADEQPSVSQDVITKGTVSQNSNDDPSDLDIDDGGSLFGDDKVNDSDIQSLEPHNNTNKVSVKKFNTYGTATRGVLNLPTPSPGGFLHPQPLNKSNGNMKNSSTYGTAKRGVLTLPTPSPERDSQLPSFSDIRSGPEQNLVTDGSYNVSLVDTSLSSMESDKPAKLSTPKANMKGKSKPKTGKNDYRLTQAQHLQAQRDNGLFQPPQRAVGNNMGMSNVSYDKEPQDMSTSAALESLLVAAVQERARSFQLPSSDPACQVMFDPARISSDNRSILNMIFAKFRSSDKFRVDALAYLMEMKEQGALQNILEMRPQVQKATPQQDDQNDVEHHYVDMKSMSNGQLIVAFKKLRSEYTRMKLSRSRWVNLAILNGNKAQKSDDTSPEKSQNGSTSSGNDPKAAQPLFGNSVSTTGKKRQFSATSISGPDAINPVNNTGSIQTADGHDTLPHIRKRLCPEQSLQQSHLITSSSKSNPDDGLGMTCGNPNTHSRGGKGMGDSPQGGLFASGVTRAAADRARGMGLLIPSGESPNDTSSGALIQHNENKEPALEALKYQHDLQRKILQQQQSRKEAQVHQASQSTKNDQIHHQHQMERAELFMRQAAQVQQIEVQQIEPQLQERHLHQDSQIRHQVPMNQGLVEQQMMEQISQLRQEMLMMKQNAQMYQGSQMQQQPLMNQELQTQLFQTNQGAQVQNNFSMNQGPQIQKSFQMVQETQTQQNCQVNQGLEMQYNFLLDQGPENQLFQMNQGSEIQQQVQMNQGFDMQQLFPMNQEPEMQQTFQTNKSSDMQQPFQMNQEIGMQLPDMDFDAFLKELDSSQGFDMTATLPSMAQDEAHSDQGIAVPQHVNNLPALTYQSPYGAANHDLYSSNTTNSIQDKASQCPYGAENYNLYCGKTAVPSQTSRPAQPQPQPMQDAIDLTQDDDTTTAWMPEQEAEWLRRWRMQTGM